MYTYACKHIVVEQVLIKMTFFTNYFNWVSTEEHITASFKQRELQKTMVAQPVQRSRMHALESEGLSQITKDNAMFQLDFFKVDDSLVLWILGVSVLC